MPQTKERIKLGKSKADDRVERYEEHKGLRSNWESYWQTLHDYFYVEAANFNRSYASGEELDATYLWDATTLESADIFASGFMNYLTPPSSKWFRLRAKKDELQDNKTVGNFLEEVAEEVNHALNHSNFYDQMFPSYKSSGVYGTSIVLEEDDMKDDVRFYNIPLKQVIPIEDATGRLIECFIEFEYTVLQAKLRWGIENLSDEMQRELREGKDNNKHKFLLYLGQRHIREVQKIDKKNMPIEATWIDVKSRHIVDEGGYNEFPIMAHRFDKRPFMVWGFSPAMKALPFARMLNVMAKTTLRSTMKHADPPIAAPNNAFLMPFNMNPRAVNYYNKKHMDSGKDLFSFGNFGDPNAGMNSVEYYAMKVRSLMYNDIFLAFNQIDKRMNNPEVMERINEKMTLLGPAVGRYLAEILQPIVIRTIGILARKNKLPIPPEEMILSPEYEIDFVGALAQAQRRSDLNALITSLTMIGNMAQYAPEVLDKVNPDKVTDEVWGITGAPIQVLRDDAEIQDIREVRAEQAAKAQEAQMLNAVADTAQKAGKAEAEFSKAKETNK